MAISIAIPAAPSAGAPNATIVLKLNDSTANDSISRHPFFILDVYKPICNPCDRMKAAIDELSTELGAQASFGTIDGKKNQRTESEYNITTYPTLLVFENGTLVDKIEGFASKKYIVDRLHMKNRDLNVSSVIY